MAATIEHDETAMMLMRPAAAAVMVVGIKTNVGDSSLAIFPPAASLESTP